MEPKLIKKQKVGKCGKCGAPVMGVMEFPWEPDEFTCHCRKRVLGVIPVGRILRFISRIKKKVSK